MRKILIIGIGAGNPDYITVQAINALNEVDLFFMTDKGSEKDDLVRLRRDICERYIKDKPYRIIEVEDPERDRAAAEYEIGRQGVARAAPRNIRETDRAGARRRRNAPVSSSGVIRPSTTARCG